LRIVINIKCNGCEVALVPRLDQSSSDNENEIHAGHALYAQLEAMFGKMEKKATRAKSRMAVKLCLLGLGALVLVYTLMCLWSMGARWFHS